MQMERLPCVLRIHGEPVANETIPGGPISPLSSPRGWMETAWAIGIERDGWWGAQTAELARRLRSAAPDALLANYGPTGVALLPVCKKVQMPLIVHFHGYDAHMIRVTRKHQENYRLLGNRAAAVIAVSHGMAQALGAMGIPEGKIHLLRYGVDPEQFSQGIHSAGLPPRFFGAGRFTDKKAPYLTLLAFSKAREHLPDAKLILAGTGELLETVKNLASALKLGDSVEFRGVLQPDDVAHEMRNATAFVQHSLEPACGESAGDREGTPVAVLEAMMSGLPVISTRHAGIAEVVEHGRTGLLVEERDVDGMAAAMVTLAKDRGLAFSYGVAGREKAMEQYSAERYASELTNVIRSAILNG